MCIIIDEFFKKILVNKNEFISKVLAQHRDPPGNQREGGLHIHCPTLLRLLPLAPQMMFHNSSRPTPTNTIIRQSNE